MVIHQLRPIVTNITSNRIHHPHVLSLLDQERSGSNTTILIMPLITSDGWSLESRSGSSSGSVASILLCVVLLCPAKPAKFSVHDGRI
jgi:hypothetical protein